MNCKKVTSLVTDWLSKKLEESNQTGFVVGVSGGVDSGVVSTLCAMTEKTTILLNMPIQQNNSANRADEHMADLRKRFSSNVYTGAIDLSEMYAALNSACTKAIPNFLDLGAPQLSCSSESIELSEVNSRSRIRMCTLYYIANCYRCLVTGTGNKVEDYGIGFFTKYGDGGVDISPIGDLVKTEVYEMAEYLDVIESIQTAEPSDDLWDDGRSDETQIGATYLQLQEAMHLCEKSGIETIAHYELHKNMLTTVPEATMMNYLTRHENNSHKMKMPDIYKIAEFDKV